MISNAYIVDFFEPGQVADAYNHYFQHFAFILNTTDELRLATQVKIRFNLPDGHGTTVMARVVSTLPDGGYGLQLSDNAPTLWLIEKSREYARRLERVRRKSAGKAVPGESVPAPPPAPQDAPPQDIVTTRPITPPEAAPAHRPLMVDHRAGPQTKPISPPKREKVVPATAAPSVPGPPEVDQLVPSDLELRQRVAELDAFIAATEGEPGQTLQASPPAPRRPSPPPVEEQEQPLSPPLEEDAAIAAPETPTAKVVPEDKAAERLKQISALSENQKKKLAISGGKDERAILMADPDTSLHLWVFKNPALTEAEVVEYAANPELAPDALNFLLQNRRWGTAPGVAHELVLNPRTPPEAIPNLLTVLPRATLESLANLPGVRHLVARQARRILMERS
jgi:hypothetical protein